MIRVLSQISEHNNMAGCITTARCMCKVYVGNQASPRLTWHPLLWPTLLYTTSEHIDFTRVRARRCLLSKIATAFGDFGFYDLDMLLLCGAEEAFEMGRFQEETKWIFYYWYIVWEQRWKEVFVFFAIF